MIFEENQSCIDVAKYNNFFPQTKHITVKYDHFRRFTQKNVILISYIEINDETEDIFTKTS